MNFRRFVAAMLCSALASAAELPVRSVILYKHGVGYFERSGPLAAGESGRLDFKASEMNDVLKSLTVNDSGGKVTGIRYDSNVPLGEKLDEFPFRLAAGQTLSAVLDQLKGARIELEFGQQKIAGAIVSARLIPGDKDHAEHEQLTLLTDSGDIRNLDLSAASAVRFADPKLHTQFRDYLAALTGARSKDKRSVYIDSTDSKSREVHATYIMPMPAWKSSYRLLFENAAPEPTLEGWAIVDNTTGEDWTNVRMSLVSGKPISFISMLYDPKYIARQSAELPEDVAVAPTIHNGALEAKAGPMAEQRRASGAVGGVIGGVPGASDSNSFLRMDGAHAPPPPPSPVSSVSIAGSATEIADLFEYSIATPVTVKKNESAMLPFLQKKITGRKLIIYSDPNTANPLSAAELTNNTGRTLDGGPVTVYDGATYAGEALVETIKGGDKRFISYGVDLGTRISTRLNSSIDSVRELHLRNGMLTARSARIEKRIYSIRNVDARAKTLIIEHPVRGGVKLSDTAKPLETASNVYRFEIRLAPEASAEFPVTEESFVDERNAISSITPDNLLIYTRNKALSDTARRQLQQLADLKTQIAALTSERARTDAEIQNLNVDEQRNRQNISSLSSVSGQQQLVQDYARKLADQEGQIAKLRTRQGEIDVQRTSLQSQLNTAIGKLEF